MEEKKKKVGFNIIKNDSTDGHGGFGVGTLSLNNVSPVIIDVEAGTASIEIGAMHARTDVEKGIKFLPNKSEVPNGKPYWLIWVTIDRRVEGPYYAGVTACEMTVDRSIRRGYKSLPEHVNNLDKSIKRKIIVEHMDAASKKVLGEFLKNHNEEIWNNSSTELKNQLGME
jgi:hypothetical protein